MKKISNPNKTVVMNMDLAIRKKTLKLKPIKKKEFYLMFNYDCSKEVEITLCLFVKEKADHALITRELVSANKSLNAPPFVKTLPGGKNVSYPESFTINFDNYPQNFFFESKENYYPMVIKLVMHPFIVNLTTRTDL